MRSNSPDLLETRTSRLPIPGSSSPNTLNIFHLRLGAEKKDPKRRIRVPEVFLTVVRPKPTTTAVVKGCTQLHSDGLTFVPKHRTQPSLSTPPCGPHAAGGCPVVSATHRKTKVAHTCVSLVPKWLEPKCLRRLLWLLWVVVGCCGLLWAVVGCCGLLWVVVGCCGLLWVVVDDD